MSKLFNFICPETGEKFFVSGHKISFKGSEAIYKDSRTGDELVNPKNGVPLEFVERDREDYRGISFMESTIDRRDKHTEHFKDVAKQHNASEEALDQRHKAISNEMGSSYADTDRKITRSKAKKK